MAQILTGPRPPSISPLTAITGDNIASGDLAVVVDVSDTAAGAGGTDKKLTMSELAAALAAADYYTAR